MKGSSHILCFLLFFVFMSSFLFGYLEETASLQEFMYGTTDATAYDNWKTHVVEGIEVAGYNKYAGFDRQLDGFGTFTVPTEEDLNNWQSIASLLISGDLDLTQTIIDGFGYPYQAVLFHDTDTDRDYYMLREVPDEEFVDNNDTPANSLDDEIGAFTLGWGIFIFDPDAPNPEIVTVVHPNDDFPTIPVSVHTFQILNARYLLISGVGREVAWSEDGDFTNNKSTCDPSRIEDLPYNKVYQAFCDEIRATFEKREFSIQVHTYDWGNSHAGYSNIQISSGYNKRCPDLPIRDHSGQGKDMVNLGSDELVPANLVGAHPAVMLNDYSTYFYYEYDFEYSDEDTTYAVNNHVDLTGHPTNRQMLYTIAGLNQYDSYDAFFHIELDELPNFFPQDNFTYDWFYGWDVDLGYYVPENYFTKTILYYSEWIHRLRASMDYVNEMDDNQIPATPSNLTILGENYNNINLSWDKSDSYDFYTYEILYDTVPIANNSYNIYSRDNNSRLACLSQTEATISGLSNNSQYYIAIRALDKNGNYSDISEEIIAFTGAANINDIVIMPGFNQAELYWTNTSQQTNYAGMNIYRKTAESVYTMVAGYETNPTLVSNGEGTQDYSYFDTSIMNNVLYYYRLAVVDNMGNEFWDGEVETVAVNTMKKLLFTKVESSERDSIFFSVNQNSIDYIDDLDVEKEASTEFCAVMYQEDFSSPYTDHEEYLLDSKSMIDVNSQYKKWIIRFRTTDTESQVNIDLDDYIRDSERLYLEVNNTFVNLAEDYYSFVPSGTDWITMNLYWGNVIPGVNFGNSDEIIMQPGDVQTFAWEYSFNQLIDRADLYVQDENIMLPLALNMGRNVTSFDWIVPEILSNDIRPVLVVHMNEEDQFVYDSNQHFAIVGNEHFVQTSLGWDLIAHPFINETNTVAEIYGADTEFWMLDVLGFMPATELDRNYGYWIDAQEAYYSIVEQADIEVDDYTFNIDSGWNIFPNPSLIDYDINQLRFEFDGHSYDYTEAVQNYLIQPLVYGTNNGLMATSKIEKYKAYYLYSYQNSVILRIAPFYNPHFSTTYEIDWSIALVASQQRNNNSGIKVGSSQFATAGYDFQYDLFQPTFKPIETPVNMELVHEFEGIDIPIQQIIDGAIALDESTVLEWDFTLEADIDFDLSFAAEQLNIPDYLNAYVLINDVYYDLNDEDGVIIQPDGEVTAGKLILTNETLTDAEDIQVPALFTASNYPNPFNPTTTIQFSLPSSQNVEVTIYNVKGQKVKALLKDNRDAGNHKLTWLGDDDEGNSVSSGVYFYKVRTKSQKNIIKKMLLMK